MKIKAYTDYNERNNRHFYTEFEVKELSQVSLDELESVRIDVEQPKDECFDYDYYRDSEGNYIALFREHDHDITFKSYQCNFDLFIDGQCFSKNTDGFYDVLDDEYDISDWIDEYLIEIENYISSPFALSYNDRIKIRHELETYLSKYIQ